MSTFQSAAVCRFCIIGVGFEGFLLLEAIVNSRSSLSFSETTFSAHDSGRVRGVDLLFLSVTVHQLWSGLGIGPVWSILVVWFI